MLQFGRRKITPEAYFVTICSYIVFITARYGNVGLVFSLAYLTTALLDTLKLIAIIAGNLNLSLNLSAWSYRIGGQFAANDNIF